ncbi:helix-turn-helix domain-containing protein [Paludibacterium paludis]|uniref:HTH-type transcriptional regulator eutR n=1 Tax=Paludibacterium paludis TaxID=1225769 RepID=A0A918U6Y5_9NEIS|nr:helix-turn-helix domain-containing protein [Paludibacterium paludis]GGY02217.1 HTH-type transcriptional regulator eutR [Paludibacterium paludis]
MPVQPRKNGPLHRLRHDSPPSDAPLDPLGAEVGVRRREAHSSFEQACAITAWQQLYDQLQPGRFAGYLKELWLDRLQCFEEFTNRALRQSCIVWPGAYWFGIPCPGQPDAARDGSTVDDNLITISPGGEEFELTTPGDFHIMGLVVPRDALETHANITLDGGLPAVLANTPLLQVNPARKREFIRRQRELLTEAERSRLGPSDVVAYRFMRHELLDNLTDLLASASPAPAPLRSRQQHWRQVRRARDFAMSQPDVPLVVADLCNHLNVSRRTLQNIFHNTLGICPLSYLKAMRLNAVRRELLSPESRYLSVQDAATDWGFWHLSQFAVDYGRLFGEKPSDTLRRREK